MGEKKVTMRQIAKVCGCSLATVSYALNHTGQGKISSATRLRVIDTAKRLNYPTTRTIRGKKNRAAILVTTVDGESAGRRLHLTDLAMQLECQLLALGIPSVILRLRDLVEDWRKILAVSPSVIFVLDGGCQAVAHVNPPCVTPMIFVDCDNNDPLYYKILPDYPSLFGQARQKLGREDLFLVAEPVRSGQLMTLLTQGFPPQDVCFHNGCRILVVITCAALHNTLAVPGGKSHIKQVIHVLPVLRGGTAILRSLSLRFRQRRIVGHIVQRVPAADGRCVPVVIFRQQIFGNSHEGADTLVCPYRGAFWKAAGMFRVGQDLIFSVCINGQFDPLRKIQAPYIRIFIVKLVVNAFDILNLKLSA